MQWVASKHFALAVVLAPLLAGLFTFISTSSISDEPSLPEVQYCFEPDSATLRVTTLQGCPVDLISLGSGALSESATATGEIVNLQPLLQARFDSAKIAAARENVDLYITSGFRTEQRQGELFAQAVRKYGSESEAAKWVLPARASHHPEGLAIDINYPGDRPGARWLDREGYRFGLCRVYANEWWHFEAVSAPGESCPAMAANALVDFDPADLG